MSNDNTRRNWIAGIILAFLAMAFLIIRFRQVSEQPVIPPTPTRQATATFSISPIITPTDRPLPLPTEITSTPTPEPTATNTPTATSTPIPEVEITPSPTPYEYTVKRGDWLSKIARRHTGNAQDWPRIVSIHDEAAEMPENQHLRRHISRNPDLIFTGEVLRLPQDWVQEGP